MALLAWGCAAPRHDLNLWPLLQYTHDDADDYRELRLVGPLIRSSRDGGVDVRAVHPLVHSWTGKDGDRQVFFLWPLGRYLENESKSEFRLLPLFLQRAHRYGEHRRSSFLFFPLLYVGNSTEFGHSFGLFLLWGNVKDIAGRDEIRWVLFPFWLTTRIGDRRSWNAPWPLVGGSRSDDGSSFKILPFYAYSRKDGQYHRTTFLWPIFHVQRNDLDTKDPTSLFFLFPLFGIEQGVHKHRWVILWPFFSYSKNEVSGIRYLTAPWPFLQWAETPDAKRFRAWPFYGTYRDEELKSRYYLWPIVWSRVEETRRYRKRTFRVIPFWQSVERTSIPEGEVSRAQHLWPIYLSTRDPDGSRGLQILDFAPRHDLPGLIRLFSPLWTLYRRAGSPDKGDAEAVWGAVRHRWSGGRETYSLPWIYSYRKEEDGSCDRSFLLGLVQVASGPRGGAFRLLTLPLFRW